MSRGEVFKGGWVVAMVSLLVLVSFKADVNTAASAKPSWTKLERKDLHFSVAFPSKYKQDLSEGDVKTYKFNSELNDVIYYLGVTAHEAELTDHEDLAQTSVDAFNEVLGGEILTQTVWQVKKNKGLKANILIPASNSNVDYRVILVGQEQYQILTMYQEGTAYDTKLAEKFFKSLKIK